MDNGAIHNMNGGYQGGGGYGMESQQQNNTNGGQAEENGDNTNREAPKYSDINMILDQILTMSDQNIDEAQVVIAKQHSYEVSNTNFNFMWSRPANTPSTATE